MASLTHGLGPLSLHVFEPPVAEADSLPSWLGQAVVQYELVIHLAPAELLLVVVAGGRRDVPEPGLPAPGHVVSPDHGHAGYLRVVLVSTLGCRADVFLLLRVSRGPDQSLVINCDLVVHVDVVLGLVDFGCHDNVEPGHGEGHSVPDKHVGRQVAVSSPIPDNTNRLLQKVTQIESGAAL